MNKDLHKDETITRKELMHIIDALLFKIKDIDANLCITNIEVQERNELNELRIGLQRTLIYRDKKINIE